jgi:hypothetical protein
MAHFNTATDSESISMSTERDIRFDLIARLCPNTTGAELRSVATEVWIERFTALESAHIAPRPACLPSELDGRSPRNVTF